MDSAMFQLRSFVHQRLYAAAEEILGEVEKTLSSALHQAQVFGQKEEAGAPTHQPEQQRRRSAEASLTSSKVEHGAESDTTLENLRPLTPQESNSGVPGVPGPSQSSADTAKSSWNYCLVKVGDMCLPGILPESLSSQIPLPSDHPELSSSKTPKRMKRKRSAGQNPQGNSCQAVGTQEHRTALNPSQLSLTSFPPTADHKAAPVPSHTAVHSHPSAPVSPATSSTATPAASPPRIFKEICSILPLSSGGKKKRCKITVEELARRVGPPEYMSFSSLVAYLRADNNTRKELQAQLEEAGIKPSDLTTEITLFSRLCEEEIDALCESLADLVQDHLPFQGLHVIPEAEDELVTLGRLLEFRFHLKRAITTIKARVEVVDLASHGFMSKMLDIILFVFERCLDNQMSGRLIY